MNYNRCIQAVLQVLLTGISGLGALVFTELDSLRNTGAASQEPHSA